jgi:hypothetical protein
MLPLAWAPTAVPNERFHIMPNPVPMALIQEIAVSTRITTLLQLA